MHNVEVKDGVMFFNPPLKVESALLFAYDHLDCNFIMKPLSSCDSKALIIACASSPEFSSNINNFYTKEYEEKGYIRVNGFSSSMVDSID